MSMLNQSSSSFNTRSIEARLAFLFVLLLCVGLCEGWRRLQVARAKKLLERQQFIASEAAAELLGSVIECEINTKRTKTKKRVSVSCRPTARPASEEAQLHPSEDLVEASPLEEPSSPSEVTCSPDCAASHTRNCSIKSEESDDEVSLRTDSVIEAISRASVSCRLTNRLASEELQLHPSEDLLVESPLEEHSYESEVDCSPDCAESCASTRSIMSEESDDEGSLGTDSDILSISEFLELPPGLAPPPGLDHPPRFGSPEAPCNQIYSRAALLQTAVFLKTHVAEVPPGFKPLMLHEAYGLNKALNCDSPRSHPRAWVANARPRSLA